MKEIGWAIINRDCDYRESDQIFNSKEEADDFIEQENFINKHRIISVKIYY